MYKKINYHQIELKGINNSYQIKNFSNIIQIFLLLKFGALF